jgi:transcriptional regulator with XRE-family HTH domain
MAKPAQRSIRKQWERKIFIDLLRALRKQKGFTQAQLAECIGARQAFVSKYETGKVYLEFLDVVAICDALNISIVKFAELYDAFRSGPNGNNATRQLY